jgi:hypothetical protein
VLAVVYLIFNEGYLADEEAIACTANATERDSLKRPHQTLTRA